MTHATDIRNLPAGTLVVSNLDGEPGRVVAIWSRTNGKKYTGPAAAYIVQTENDGREVWMVEEFFVPDDAE